MGPAVIKVVGPSALAHLGFLQAKTRKTTLHTIEFDDTATMRSCERRVTIELLSRLASAVQQGPVAQLVEHRTFNAVVAGSSPARLTIIPKNFIEPSRGGLHRCLAP